MNEQPVVSAQADLEQAGLWMHKERLIGGAVLAACLVALAFMPVANWIPVLGPLAVGALVPLLSHAVLTQWLNGGDVRFGELRTRSLGKGRFSRWVVAPFATILLAIWRWSAGISGAHSQAGLRLSALIYASGAVALVVYVASLAVLTVIILGLVIWGVLKVVGGVLAASDDSPSEGAAESPRPTSSMMPADSTSVMEAGFHPLVSSMRYSRTSKNAWGDDITEYFDRHYNKIAEGRVETDAWGDQKFVLYDNHGSKLGESHEGRDIWGGQGHKARESVAGGNRRERRAHRSLRRADYCYHE